jgi:predicted negative regulator of RcsB-dependent stress response
VAKRHLTRKEIKQPDQFVSSSVQLMEWTKSHVHYFLYGMLGILAIVGVLVAWSVWQKQRQQQAEILLYEAVKLLNPDGERGNSTPSQTLAKFQRIAEEFSTTSSSAFAYWYLGHQYYEQGNYTAALVAYQQAQSRFSRHKDLFMPVLISLNIGYTQEASDLCDGAIRSFEQVLQSPAHWLRGEALLGIGRCHEKQGAIDAAINTYDRALSETALDATTRQKVEEQRVRLRATQEPRK